MFTHAEGGHDILRKLHLKSAGCISKFTDLLTRLGRTEATLLRKEERIAMRNSKSDEGRSVFVTNIENGITIDMLFDLLAQFGWLEKVELKETRDGTPLYAKGFFKYREAAQRAVDVLNQKNIFGRPISLCIVRQVCSGASHFPTISSTGDDFATPNVFPLPSHEGIIWSPNDGTETSSPLSSATSEFHFRY
ncbi:unnamed protein product [Toxocara canis]|uniref:RRM domain-containing protein n=1 Tax=Toxocara canis TaxID=6265 RepID=A0A183UR23_TOXCA|nr:unnamed protein product [Toxocara canis]